jgi:hypothetical protein
MIADQLAQALREARETLADERLCTWRYLEGSEIHDDFREAVEKVDAALAAYDAALSAAPEADTILRELRKRLINLGAAILAQRHWGEPIPRISAEKQDDALADLGLEARKIADALSAWADAQKAPQPRPAEPAPTPADERQAFEALWAKLGLRSPYTHDIFWRVWQAARAYPAAEPVMGGRESLEDALMIVESFGPGIDGVNDTFARQIILADEVKRLRSLLTPCGCRLGECESKADRLCRMTVEIASPAAEPKLTDEQIDRAIERHVGGAELTDDDYDSMRTFARAIEAASRGPLQEGEPG